MKERTRLDKSSKGEGGEVGFKLLIIIITLLMIMRTFTDVRLFADASREP